MKRVFLIDVENVGVKGLSSIERTVSNRDKVIVFHSYIHGDDISESIMEKIRNKAGVYEVIKTYTHTKNAIDFQICTYLGYMVKQEITGTTYYVVSSDKGYQASLEFLKKLEPAAKIKQISSTLEVAEEIDAIAEIKNILSGFSKKAISVTTTAMQCTDSLSDYHNYICLKLKDDGPKIYNLTKELYKQSHE